MKCSRGGQGSLDGGHEARCLATTEEAGEGGRVAQEDSNQHRKRAVLLGISAKHGTAETR